MRKSATLVNARAVAEALGIPVWAVYRLVEQGRLPVQEVSSTWTTRKRYLFNLADVRARYAEIEAEHQRVV